MTLPCCHRWRLVDGKLGMIFIINLFTYSCTYLLSRRRQLLTTKVLWNPRRCCRQGQGRSCDAPSCICRVLIGRASHMTLVSSPGGRRTVFGHTRRHRPVPGSAVAPWLDPSPCPSSPASSPCMCPYENVTRYYTLVCTRHQEEGIKRSCCPSVCLFVCPSVCLLPARSSKRCILSAIVRYYWITKENPLVTVAVWPPEVAKTSLRLKT